MKFVFGWDENGQTLADKIKSKLSKEVDPDEGKKLDVLKQSNKYQRGLLSTTSEKLNDYINIVKSEIDDVQNDYKGFIDLEDKEFFEK